MPNFKVSRRRKTNVEQNPPEVEEKIDDSEMQVEESDDEYIDQAIEAVKRVRFEEPTPKPKPRPRFPEPTPRRQPQYPIHPNVAQKPLVLEPKKPYRPPRRRMNDPYTRKPTMDFPNPYSKYRRGGAKLRYRSHYGPGGEHLDTRTKASMFSHFIG